MSCQPEPIHLFVQEIAVIQPLNDVPVAQPFGTLVPARLALKDDARHRSVASLNLLLAHSMALRDLYKKAHWQVSGPTFYELHLLFDKHHQEQLLLCDALAERVQTLGGVAIALAHDISTTSDISRAPSGRECPVQQLRRLVDAHERILRDARSLARRAVEDEDDGSNDMIVSGLIRPNELQCWVLSEHLAGRDAPNE